jgi:2-haloacid dehalogenase
MPTPPLDLSRTEALTFDCYGTLIDWEAGILAALKVVLEPRGVHPADDELLEAHARHEPALESGEYLSYREVLGRCLQRLCAEQGVVATLEEQDSFANSVPDWPAFPDAPVALRRLKGRFRLGVLTNCDDDLFAASNERLGVEFDWVVTAQQLRSYKPAIANFEALIERVGLSRDRIVHVAQSLYHDHVPAQRLGLTSVWIDRRHGLAGGGATPIAEASPNATYRDMATFAMAAVSD